jgi:hypothetical protein
MEQNNKPPVELVTFLDSFQRTVIGELIENEDKSVLSVKNPVVVNVIPQIDQVTGQPSGQMALQLLPLFFREFLGDKTEPVVLNYNKSLITPIKFNGGFDWRLYGQYQTIFTPPSQQIATPRSAGQPTPASKDNVIKLFPD